MDSCAIKNPSNELNFTFHISCRQTRLEDRIGEHVLFNLQVSNIYRKELSTFIRDIYLLITRHFLHWEA
ncbi:hypothetical protein EUTSA_v10006357mg [Eutrema salsugineum]|uniref:Uncharacterized protein n=1 Tax=Eutrema salsugineum TaxID=72664 RepID=V4LX89_EUTSA|nr:hypothetical protein EUTSA_v10006357mg [Eutrema salsugineum]